MLTYAGLNSLDLRPQRWCALGTRFVTGLALCMALPLLAQDSASRQRYSIQGVVFDSVAGAPLAGAQVQVVAENTSGYPYTAQTDATGRYRVAGLPTGRFLIGFYHDALTTLGLDAPTQSVALTSDSVVTLDLAIPSSRTIRTLRCGDPLFESSSGMMVGFVRDAGQRTTIPAAALRLSWRAFALESGNYRVVTERAAAQIESDGSYLVCHLPIDAPLDLRVVAPGYRMVDGSVALIPANGIGRLDVALVDSTFDRGPAIIRGRVTRASGKAVSAGRVLILALGREVPIQDGNFVLSDLPLGSWVVETRVIGSDPKSVIVNANDSATTTAAIAVSDQAQHLDAVTVMGKKDANALLLDEVLRRKRIGMGTVFLPGSPALTSAIFTADVMREARGFMYKSPTAIFGRADSHGGRCANIAVYVDDLLQPFGFDGLNTIVTPGEVLAIETFPDIMFAPMQYRSAKTVLTTNGLGKSELYCAVVLVWTKNRPHN